MQPKTPYRPGRCGVLFSGFHASYHNVRRNRAMWRMAEVLKYGSCALNLQDISGQYTRDSSIALGRADLSVWKRSLKFEVCNFISEVRGSSQHQATRLLIRLPPKMGPPPETPRRRRTRMPRRTRRKPEMNRAFETERLAAPKRGRREGLRPLRQHVLFLT